MANKVLNYFDQFCVSLPLAGEAGGNFFQVFLPITSRLPSPYGRLKRMGAEGIDLSKTYSYRQPSTTNKE
jgi:hypothetical protein